MNVNVCSARLNPICNKSGIGSDNNLDSLMNYFITTAGSQDILITSNIYLNIEHVESQNQRLYTPEYNRVLHYKITLYSYKLTLKQLKETVTKWTITYREYIKEKTKSNYSMKILDFQANSHICSKKSITSLILIILL